MTDPEFDPFSIFPSDQHNGLERAELLAKSLAVGVVAGIWEPTFTIITYYQWSRELDCVWKR